ncbi:MAG: zinc-dependent peptidase [Spirochaetota bacterium]
MGLLSERRRRRILARRPISDTDWEAVIRSRSLFATLGGEERDRLRVLATLFLREKHWESPYGPVDEFLPLLVSATAALAVLGLDIDWFANWRTVVLIPRAVAQEHVEEDEHGVVQEWMQADSGESWENGPVVLSVRDVEEARDGGGYNVVLHEAAHRIDMSDGEINGRPALHGDPDAEEWLDVCGEAFGVFRDRVERGARTRIDPYAAEDDAEFFAVMSEYFFERPRIVRAEFPELYDLLARFYRQDPAEREERVRGKRRRSR